MSSEQAERYKTQGNQALQGGMYDEAVRLYTLAVREDPFNEVYFSNRSAAFVALKQFKEALDDADEVVRIKPAWVKGHTRRGAALSGMKKHEEARKAYAKACDLEPANAQVRQQMEAEAKAAAAATEKSKNWEDDLWSDDEDGGGGGGGGGGDAAAAAASSGCGTKRAAPEDDGAAEQQGGGARKKRRAPGKLMAQLGRSLADASRDTLRVCLQQLCGADEDLAERTLQMLEGLNENSSNGEDNDDDGSDDDGGGASRGVSHGGGGGEGGGRKAWPKPPAMGSGSSRRVASGDAEDSD